MVRVFSTQVDVVKQTISSLSVDEIIASSESVEYISVSEATSLASGNSETVNISPPAGYLYEIMDIAFNVSAPSGATSGTHMLVADLPVSKAAIFQYSSVYGTALGVRWGIAYSADDSQKPSTEISQVMRSQGLRFSSTNILQLKYHNQTDAAQGGTRDYRVIARKIKVA